MNIVFTTKPQEFLLAKESILLKPLWIMSMRTRGDQEKTKTLSGARFFLSIVDDYSRRVWVYPLKSKDETFFKFKEWKTLTERKTNKKLKCLRTGNGLEFLNY